MREILSEVLVRPESPISPGSVCADVILEVSNQTVLGKQRDGSGSVNSARMLNATWRYGKAPDYGRTRALWAESNISALLKSCWRGRQS
jgi:hypothetical protein